MKFFKYTLTLIILVLSTSVNAALVSRLGGLAYYDTEADLTWLTDANYAFTSGYRTRVEDGRMRWDQANNWASTLEVEGVTGWRLPTTLQPDPSCSNQDNGSNGFSCSGSELGNMFNTVIGSGWSGVSWELTTNSDYDLFENIQHVFWSGTEDGLDASQAWAFSTYNGATLSHPINTSYFAWAVHDGDVSAVPVPAAMWLFGSGLIGLVGFARRK